MSRMKAHMKARVRGVTAKAEKLDHDLRAAKYDEGLHNRRGGGLLPSQLGWGQHRSRRDRITLFDVWRS